MQKHIKRDYVPGSFMAFFIASAILSILFFDLFEMGRMTGDFFIGPWANLMLVVGCLGMMLVSATAIICWILGVAPKIQTSKVREGGQDRV